jgi:glutathione S-transferase
MATSYTLYHSPLLPACRKIRLMLREKNIPHTLKQEDFWNRRAEFFVLNPAGEVPVLAGGTRTVGTYAMQCGDASTLHMECRVDIAAAKLT